MISSVFFMFLCVISATSDEDVKDYDIPQLLQLFKNLLEYRPEDVTPEDVTFYLFTRSVSNVQIPLESTDTIDATKNTKMIIHGFMDNHNRSWYHHLTEEYLIKGDFSIIQVDWGRVARSFYFSSAQNTKLVGALIAEFILNHNIPVEKLHLIGHSLGAHIAASAAKIVNYQNGTRVKRISALDPAGPGFRNIFVERKNRLDREDADVVDVIHTDGGMFGLYRPLGTFDIYINGGTRIQPDCYNLEDVSSAGELFEDSYCSHTRSYVRFTEMINGIKYTCQKCEYWLKYVLGFCKFNEYYVFGAEDINEEMSGVCFVNTVKPK